MAAPATPFDGDQTLFAPLIEWAVYRDARRAREADSEWRRWNAGEYPPPWDQSEGWTPKHAAALVEIWSMLVAGRIIVTGPNGEPFMRSDWLDNRWTLTRDPTGRSPHPVDDGGYSLWLFADFCKLMDIGALASVANVLRYFPPREIAIPSATEALGSLSAVGPPAWPEAVVEELERIAAKSKRTRAEDIALALYQENLKGLPHTLTNPQLEADFYKRHPKWAPRSQTPGKVARTFENALAILKRTAR